METAALLFGLRVISAGLLVAFMAALFWLVMRDYRRAVLESANQRRSYGQLVGLLDANGKMIPTGQNYPLMPLTSLGRAPSNNVPIDDNFASGEHAVLSRRSDQWWLEDRKSRNGTTLNGIPVERAMIVTEGDIIGIGKMCFRIEFGEELR